MAGPMDVRLSPVELRWALFTLLLVISLMEGWRVSVIFLSFATMLLLFAYMGVGLGFRGGSSRLRWGEGVVARDNRQFCGILGLLVLALRPGWSTMAQLSWGFDLLLRIG